MKINVPYNIGDQLYFINEHGVGEYYVDDRWKIEAITIEKGNVIISTGFKSFNAWELGIYVFLNMQDAENKLKELSPVIPINNIIQHNKNKRKK